MNALHKSEGPLAGGPIAEQSTGNAIIVCCADAERKRLAGLRAVLALHGNHVVHEMAEGGFVVAWRGVSRTLRDLDELTAFAHRVGAIQ